MCGRGVASRAKGLGADVIVTEIDPIRAIEAAMDGFRVMGVTTRRAWATSSLLSRATSTCWARSHFELMKDGAILANAGHFNIELDLDSLRAMSSAQRRVRPEVEEFSMEGDRKIYVLAEGRLVNLAAAEGHPASVMDMSFANQALCCEWLKQNADSLEAKVYPVPGRHRSSVASLKLESMGKRIDELTPEQEAYLSGWEEGT